MERLCSCSEPCKPPRWTAGSMGVTHHPPSLTFLAPGHQQLQGHSVWKLLWTPVMTGSHFSALNTTSQKSKVRHNKTKSHQQAHSSSKRHSTALYAALFYSSSILPQKSQFSTPPMIVSLVRIKMGKNFAQVQIDSIITILLHTLI